MNNEFNNIIKKHVDAHHSDIDPQEIWDGILAKQKPKRKKRIMILPFLLGVALVLTSMWWLNQNEMRLYTNANTQAELESAGSTPSLAKALPNSPTSNTLNPNALKTNTLNPHKLNPQNQTINNSNQSTKSLSARQQNNTKDKLNEQVISSAELNKKSRLTINPLNREFNNKIGYTLPQIQQNSDIVLSDYGFIQSSLTNNLVNNISNIRKPVIINEKGDNKGKAVPNINSMFPRIKTRDNLQNIDLLPLASSNSVVNNKPFYIEPTHSLVKKSSLSDITFQVTIGTALISKSLTGMSDYVAPRETSERMLESYHSDFTVKMPLSSRWAIETGLAYQRDFQKFEWAGTILRNGAGDDLLNVRDKEEIDLPTTLTAVYYETVDQNIKYYNSYTYIDWPIVMSYNLTLGQWRTSIMAGVSINVHKDFKGKYLDENTLPKDLSSLSTAPSVGPKYLAGLQVLYPLSPSLGFLAKVDYSMRQVRETSLTSSYQGWGMRVGLGYRWP